MFEISKNILMFKIKQIFFADQINDVKGCDFLKYHFIRQYQEIPGFTCETHKTVIIDLTSDLDKLWKDISKTNRDKIKQAIKAGVSVRVSERHEDFYKMYKVFRRKKGFYSLLGDRLENLDVLKDKGTLFIAELDGELLNGTVFLIGDSGMIAWRGGSRRLNVDKEKAKLIGWANRLLFWEAMKYGKMQEIQELNMGGLWSEGQKKDEARDRVRKGLNFFKLGFGGQVVDYYIYKKSYSRIYNYCAKLYAFCSPYRKKIAKLLAVHFSHRDPGEELVAATNKD